MAEVRGSSEIITDLSNIADVIDSYNKEYERKVAALDDSSLEGARQRMKAKLGRKEEEVSPEVIKNPKDPETKKVAEAIFQEVIKSNAITREAMEKSRSLKDRVKVPGEREELLAIGRVLGG